MAGAPDRDSLSLSPLSAFTEGAMRMHREMGIPGVFLFVGMAALVWTEFGLDVVAGEIIGGAGIAASLASYVFERIRAVRVAQAYATVAERQVAQLFEVSRPMIDSYVAKAPNADLNAVYQFVDKMATFLRPDGAAWDSAIAPHQARGQDEPVTAPAVWQP